MHIFPSNISFVLHCDDDSELPIEFTSVGSVDASISWAEAIGNDTVIMNVTQAISNNRMITILLQMMMQQLLLLPSTTDVVVVDDDDDGDGNDDDIVLIASCCT